MPKKRPRFNSATKRAHNEAEYTTWRNRCAWALKTAYRGNVINDPVAMIMTCSYSDGRQIPDIDNGFGGVMDAGNGIIYKDDRLVHGLAGYKRKSDRDETDIYVVPLDIYLKAYQRMIDELIGG